MAARILLLATVDHARREFAHYGYLDTQISVQDHKNEAASTVDYTFTINPGEIYHLKSVKTVNFNDQQQKEFDKHWKLSPGSVYDESYPFTFFQTLASESFQGYSATTHTADNKNDHTVDLVITLIKKGVRPPQP